ncbi:MAG: PrsW family glutamic-type intramembrane protease [Minisyncoccia bacterium]
MYLELILKYPFFLAFIIGLIPALVWLWFWLKEDVHPEPAKILTLAFLGGMATVLFVLPLQKIVYDLFSENRLLSDFWWNNLQFTIWAGLEEIMKFLFVYMIAIRNKKVTDEPVDDIIYLIVSALGFVTLENALFLVEPIKGGDLVGTLINTNMRFVGASLVHVMSSATIGICMGLSFYKSGKRKIEYTIFGLILAIILHTGFNLFIINETTGSIFSVFGLVWIGIIAIILLFEKVKSVVLSPK